MARIIRKMNPSVTYTIIDLPEMLALQYVYLSSLEGEHNLHIVDPGAPVTIAEGKVNLVSTHMLADEYGSVQCGGFVSTWGLAESPRDAQMYVRQRDFFGASSLLLASSPASKNNILAALPLEGLIRVPVPAFGGVGTGNEYWFR